MTPGGDWCPIKIVHCNYCGGIPPVAAQRCWRVETIAGLTGLLQRTLQNIKNTMLVLVIICTIIIRAIIVQSSGPCRASRVSSSPFSPVDLVHHAVGELGKKLEGAEKPAWQLDLIIMILCYHQWECVFCIFFKETCRTDLLTLLTQSPPK